MNFVSQWLGQPGTETLGWTLLHFLWQGGLVAALLALILRCLRSASANSRYLAALAALVLSALLPVGTAVWIAQGADDSQVADSFPAGTRQVEVAEDSPADVTLARNREPVREPKNPSTADGQSRVARKENGQGVAAAPVSRRINPKSQEDSEEPARGSASWGTSFVEWLRPRLPWLVGIWLIGVFIISLRLAFAWIGVQRLRRVGLVAASPDISDRLAPLCRRLGIRRSVRLFGSPFVDVPTVIGWWRPVILFPISAFTGLAPAQWESLLAHELAHIRRWDYAVNLLQIGVETFLFYHPAVWWISRQVRAEREHCCDDLAASVTGDKVAYVKALLEMAERHVQRNHIALAAGDGDLLKRAKRLLAKNSTGPGGRFASAGGVLPAALIVGLLSMGILNAAWPKAEPDPKPAAKSEERADEIDFKNLTPERIAKEVEAAMGRFSRVRYAANFTETRNANSYLKEGVLPVSGTGKWEFVTDGRRWRAKQEGFTVNLGEAGAIPTQNTSGFDGEEFYQRERGQFVLGEDPRTNDLLKPRTVFWRGARTVEWFLAALKSWNARIDREVTIDGKKRVVILSEPGRPKPGEEPKEGSQDTRWQYEITLSPAQSWLPLKTIVRRNGKLYAEESIGKLAQTAAGVWYPEAISQKQHFQPDPLISRTIEITRLELAPAFSSRAFQYALPIGEDIVDYSSGRTWHHDPWWPEMEPWLLSKLDWPRPALHVLGDMKSHVSENTDGQTAPPIYAEKWLGKKPNAWPREDGKIRVLAFIGGWAIDPTPRWNAALRELEKRYGGDGLEVIGIATATADPELVERAYRVLKPGFPWAIDSKNEGEGNAFGRTFDAYHLRHYAGVLLVDSHGKISTLESVSVPKGSPLSPLEFAIRRALGKDVANYQPPADRLSDEDIKQIDAEWKRRRNAVEGRGKITGQIRIDAEGREHFGERALTKTLPEVAVRLRAVPQMKMLHSDTPGGWTNLMDYRHAIEEDFKAKETVALKDLRKGSYQITIRPDGLAARDVVVSLLSDDDEKEFHLDFHQGDTITGRVVGTDGKPIGGATVKAPRRHFDAKNLRSYTTSHLPDDAVTNAQGQFTLKGLFVGAFDLEVVASGYEKRTIQHVPAGKQAVKIVLQKPGEANVTMREARQTEVLPTPN